MKNDSNHPLTYSGPLEPVALLEINRYPDGGVTIIVRPRKLTVVTIVKQTFGLCLLLAALCGWIAVIPNLRPATWITLKHGGGSDGFIIFLAVLCLPVLISGWRQVNRFINRRRPAVIGIDRQTVYVDVPGSIINRRFPRSRLRGITLSKRLRGIVLLLERRPAVLFEPQRNEAEIIEIFQALKQAEAATALTNRTPG